MPGEPGRSSPKPYLHKHADRDGDIGARLPLAMPLGLCIEPTNRCNMKCRFCPVHLAEFPQIVGGLRFIDFALYEKIIDDLGDMGGQLTNLHLYGDGEPFLNPRLFDMIRLAADRGVAKHIIVTTNGSVLTPRNVEKLLGSGLTHLRVSIYGTDAEFHRQITGSTIEPRRILENIRHLRQARDGAGLAAPFIYAKMIRTERTAGQIDAFRQWYAPVADEVNVENPINWNGYGGYDLVGALDPNHTFDLASIQGWHAQAGKDNSRKKVCTTPFLSLNVKADGQVVICIVDWNKGTAVGDLRHESLASIWRGERLRQFRRMHIEGRRAENPSCRNCKVLYNSPDNIDALAAGDPERLLG